MELRELRRLLAPRFQKRDWGTRRQLGIVDAIFERVLGNDMRRALLVSIAILGLVCRPLRVVAQTVTHAVPSPRVFEPDFQNAGLEHAQPPSDVVLDALLKQIEADEMSGEIEDLDRQKKRALFETVRVHLGPAAEEDYVVHGKPPMIGADCEWFWVVRVSGGKAEILLFANGLALVLEKHVANGYCDIDVSWATAAYIGDRLYRYDVLAYKLFRERTKEQKP